ncbi:unnamed protein product [Phytophthora lilii]|uniref:Unnamed protein product n=1 Tax=Phytophthora lilii TaxID=2077276 RepID=A0A9W6XH59_9STRA|nr:unnamed protein product [Phytophthora lilii]
MFTTRPETWLGFGWRQLQLKLVDSDEDGRSAGGMCQPSLNLAVNKYLEPHEDLLSEVNNLMVELRHEKNLAELKKHTELCPVKRDTTRWSSTFTMGSGTSASARTSRKLTQLKSRFRQAAARKYRHVRGSPHVRRSSRRVINGTALSSARTGALKRFEATQASSKKRKEREEDYASQLLQGKGKKAKQAPGANSYIPLVKLDPQIRTLSRGCFRNVSLS